MIAVGVDSTRRPAGQSLGTESLGTPGTLPRASVVPRAADATLGGHAADAVDALPATGVGTVALAIGGAGGAAGGATDEVLAEGAVALELSLAVVVGEALGSAASGLADRVDAQGTAQTRGAVRTGRTGLRATRNAGVVVAFLAETRITVARSLAVVPTFTVAAAFAKATDRAIASLVAVGRHQAMGTTRESLRTDGVGGVAIGTLGRARTLRVVRAAVSADSPCATTRRDHPPHQEHHQHQDRSVRPSPVRAPSLPKPPEGHRRQQHLRDLQLVSVVAWLFVVLPFGICTTTTNGRTETTAER